MVTEEVYLDTRTKQRPWVNESLRRLLYFGVAQPAPTGDDGLITGERRQLLLTISDLPGPRTARRSRRSLPRTACRSTRSTACCARSAPTRSPRIRPSCEKLLDAQAERLKTMIAERDALTHRRSRDHAADRRRRPAPSARARSSRRANSSMRRSSASRQTSSAVDAAEELVKQKRLADAAIYARRADASALAFDYQAAADDYAKAFRLVEKWDDKLRWNYKNQEAEALARYGMRPATWTRCSVPSTPIDEHPELHPQWRTEPRLGDHPQQHGGGAADASASARPTPASLEEALHDLSRIRSPSSNARRTISTGPPRRTISATCC